MNRWKDALQQQPDAVEVRPPVETAEKQQTARVPACGLRLEVGGIDAVLDHVNAANAEVLAEAPGVHVADGDGALDLAQHAPLEVLELPPLPPDVPAPQRIRLCLVIALPDDRLDVVRDHHARSIGDAAQRLGVGRPFAVPHVHRDARGHGPPAPGAAPGWCAWPPSTAAATRDWPPDADRSEARTLTERPLDDDGGDVVLGEERGRLSRLVGIGVAVTYICQAMSPRQAQRQIERANALARGRRIGQFLIH